MKNWGFNMLQYYPFFWGDYFAKTASLSQTQHGAYMLFLRHIYGTGKPIEDKKRYHVAMAFSEEEREAADYVLENFFKESFKDNLKLWHNEKCEAVILKANELHAKKVAGGKAGGLKRVANAKTASSTPSSTPSKNSKDSFKQPKTQNLKPKEQSEKLPPNPPQDQQNVNNFVDKSKEGVLKPCFKGEGLKVDNIMHQLDDKSLARAKKEAPRWDIYELASIYIEGINSGKREAPNSIKAAFPAWCGKYTKGNAP